MKLNRQQRNSKERETGCQIRIPSFRYMERGQKGNPAKDVLTLSPFDTQKPIGSVTLERYQIQPQQTTGLGGHLVVDTKNQSR